MTTTQQFVEFLAALAPEGETALIVRQKPKLTGGQQMYHADGMLASTWPAALPTKEIKAGESWYGNTASFIVERFKDGKPRATRDYAGYVLCMVLDDIGTKSKRPALEPTWRMETSPGSEQWGYVFSDQPSKGAYAAAIKAIADAGYTDPGAINPVRNFRLPGSVNLKKGRGGFASRLVEFHPEREFTLAGICDALGVVPAAEDTGTVRAIRIEDTGHDSVLQWLSDNGLALTPANDDGWAGVICPNGKAHSNGDLEARYHVTDRGFQCFHGSCQHIKTADFLAWVADNGGPKVQIGLREELLTARMAATIDKLRPSSGEPPRQAVEADAFVEKLERMERSRLEKQTWAERYAYIESDDCYFDLVDRTTISRQAFNALYRHVLCRSARSPRLIEASIWFDENRQELGGKSLKGLTYAPGETAVVARDNGMLYGNRWMDARPQVDGAAGDVALWVDHCRTLVPDNDTLQRLFDTMAYKLQKPCRKINYAVLHIGDEGCGKDTMWAPMLWAVCGPHGTNRAVVNGDNITSQWGYALESEILVLNELHEPQAAQRRALANRLKPLIAAPPDTLTVNRKMMHPYEAANRMFVLAFSNEPIPISIATQDRRWMVVKSEAARMSERAALRIWDWFRKGGFEAVTGWLYARDVSRFNPSDIPAMTDAKRNMIEDSLSSAESWMVSEIRARRGEFMSGAVAAPFHKMIDRLQGQFNGRKEIYLSSLFHALKTAGWIDRGRLKSHDLPTARIWCAPELAGTGASELRRLAEPGQPLGNVTHLHPASHGM